MINTSNEYKNRIRKNRVFHRKATLTLADGTVLNLEDADFMNGGIRLDDSVGDKVMIGTAVINKATITLNNFKGKFDTYDFADAVIRPYEGLELSKTTEYLAKGVFTIDNPTTRGSIIVLEALDNMTKFNTEFKDVSINYPCTLLQLLQAVCLHCGANLATARFLNSSYIVKERPGEEATSCREIVAWIAQIAGSFARCNNQGALELKWFDFVVFESESNIDGGVFDGDSPYSLGDDVDGGNFTDYESGDDVDGGTFIDMKRYHHIYSFPSSPTIGTDDITITGIQVSDNAESPTTVLFGTSGYVLPIEGNPLIQSQSDVMQVADSVGKKIVGMKFRPFSCNAQSDPSMEAGDVAYISDRKGNSYATVITSIPGFTLGDSVSLSCGAETPAKRSYRPTPEMKSIVEARKAAKQEINSYDLAVKQLNDLVMHSFGTYRTEEKLEDGSTILYAHDKPTLAESKNIWKQTANTFTVSNDGGQTWRGMDADGNIVATVLNAIGVNAEWIKVLSTFTVGNNFEVNSQGILKATNAILSGKVTANSGQIGPFSISNQGLMSEIMQFYENNDYPLIWLTKKGPNGEEWGANNTERANLEPSVVVVRSIDENGTRTDANLIARKNPDSGRTGEVSISKWGNGIIHDATLSTDGIYIDKQENGARLENVELTPHGLFLQNEDGYYTIITPYGAITFSEDQVSFTGANCQIAMSEDGEISISGSKGSIYMGDDTYINSTGDIYLNGFPADLQQIQNDIMAIKAKLNMH